MKGQTAVSCRKVRREVQEALDRVDRRNRSDLGAGDQGLRGGTSFCNNTLGAILLNIRDSFPCSTTIGCPFGIVNLPYFIHDPARTWIDHSHVKCPGSTGFLAIIFIDGVVEQSLKQACTTIIQHWISGQNFKRPHRGIALVHS